MKYNEITPDQIQDWKARHGDVLSEISITAHNGAVAKFIVCPPTRVVMDAVGSHGLKKDVSASNKTLVSNCVLGGDMDAMNSDGGVYIALIRELTKLAETKEVSIKKL